MITEITMPSMGADMTEGTVVKWLKSEGDSIQRGDKILSSGGMRGKVVRVINDNDIEVEISNGVNVVMVKSTIAEVVKEQS